MTTLFLVLALAGAARPAHAQTGADPVAVAEDLNDAINAGDLDAALALFHDDAVYETPSCPDGRCQGLPAIRDILATFIADGLRITSLAPFVADGNEVQGRSQSESDGLRAAGVERIVVEVFATVRDGKFSRYAVVPDINDPETASLFAPALPASGSGGLAGPAGTPAWPAAAAAAAGVLVLGLALRRRRGRTLRQ